MLAVGGLEEEDCSGLGNLGRPPEGGLWGGPDWTAPGLGGPEKMEESSSLLLQSGHSHSISFNPRNNFHEIDYSIILIF